MSTPVLLPSVKGYFGDWVYYSSAVPVHILVSRVQFARDMYSSNPKWSEMLQREIKEERGSEIAKYLSTDERFFNSLVIGVYAGTPEWLDIQIAEHKDPKIRKLILEETTTNIGFLRLSGSEKLFALDGQHRLLGMKVAIDAGNDISRDDAPVLFVSIGDTKDGHTRARRLFTTINKRAINVGLGAKIALDEDDTIAIITRMLVDSGEMFDKSSIAFRSTASLPATEKTALTTAGNLYGLISTIIVSRAKVKTGKIQGVKRLLTDGKRLDDDTLNSYYKYALKFFKELSSRCTPINEYMTSKHKGQVASLYRSNDGGHILFRPVGLTLFATLFSECEGTTAERISFLLGHLPTDITKFPYADTIWNTTTGGIVRGTGRFPRVLHLCRYMLGFKINPKQMRSMRLALAEIQGKQEGDVDIPKPWVK